MELRKQSEQSSFKINDFSSWLQREFLKRRKKNSGYSIRAFAKFLGIASASVSHLLSGKRKPSRKFAEKIFMQIGISSEEREIVLKSLNPRPDSESPSKEKKFYLIAYDSLRMIEDWYHYAILELTSVENFRLDHAWIARQLGISVPEAREALQRLVRLDLLTVRDGTVVRTHKFLSNAEDGVTNAALKQLQRTLLTKALEAIDNVATGEKDITSMTMAIDVRKLPAARKRIEQFRRDMCLFLEDGRQTQVFNLGIQLYPISKKE